jgi:tRNA threonylcarbamoyladenosine biosynthesis protein TsaE
VKLSEAALQRWGMRLGSSIRRPAFLALRGDLGAGKSVLARAIARGAGVLSTVPSPTFNLVNRYDLPDGGAVVHVDLYRLGTPGEVWELGWADLGRGDELVLVEWPERAERLLPHTRWDITLTVPPGEPDLRVVAVERCGAAEALPGPGQEIG